MRGKPEVKDIHQVWQEWDPSAAPFIDVRSPGEFQKGHIPGSVNIPLFDNDERAEVGTLYKQVGKEAAFLKGLEMVGPKMRYFVEEANRLSPHKKLYTYCWRGGMRSNSLAWLWRQAGLEVDVVSGGYKAYRRWVLSQLGQSLDLIVLGGRTGSGKTEILHALDACGEQILDLEGMANHKGSSFGAIGEDPQPTTEHFENILHDKFSQLDPQKRIWLEDESRNIGKVFIPDVLWQQMVEAQVFIVHVPLEVRVGHLVDVYTHIDHQLLKEAVERIQRRLGGWATQQALEALEERDYAKTAEICLSYYDKAYDYGLKQKKTNSVVEITLDVHNPEKAARKLIALANERIPIQ
ncbi:MAG: tRNA 2-selenouridine(34) synthase MnmH [Bacteroidota bacterium]